MHVPLLRINVIIKLQFLMNKFVYHLLFCLAQLNLENILALVIWCHVELVDH